LAATARRIRRRPLPTHAADWPGVPPLLQRVYAQRGVDDAAQLNLDLAALLPPGDLLGVEAAAGRLQQALEAAERVLVVGDFDADGATSSALAVAALREFGADVDFLVPNRFDYGYGLTPEIVALAAQRAPSLIVTVDNGISSIEGVAAARAARIDVLVTDHHLPGEVLPQTPLIVNPNQPGCGFRSKHLAGVGVMFYLLLALRARLREQDWFTRQGIAEPHLAAYLDLVALGTVADVVPLDRNNRILVEGGLRRIRAGRARPGIAALIEVAGRDATQMTSTDLAFALGPRLNAAGRLDDMSLGIECLLCSDAQRSRALAGELDAMNRERQVIERGMEREALHALEDIRIDATRVPAALCLYDPGWHQGVVGILASRIKERFHRPVIAFADAGGGELKGSGRGIPGLHLRDILALVEARRPGLMGRFGGHAMAAGLSLRSECLDAFTEQFVAAVEAQADASCFEAVCETDGELAAQDLSLASAETLRFAGPWGQQFPEPRFDGEFALLEQRLVGERHLKMRLRATPGAEPLDAIAFGVDTERWPDPAVQRLRLVYRLDVNEWRGRRSLQLIVEQLEAL
jgi:single-stranded-DNA-specific exonuclease